jgi:energy-coupling factor transporter ATP-binding protein EcfA2
MISAINLLFDISLFGGTGILMIRASQQWRIEQSQETFDLHFPHELKAAEVTNFMRSLSGIVPSTRGGIFGHMAVTFETWAGHDGITHRLHLPRSLAGPIISQLRAGIPGMRITLVERTQESITIMRAAVELKLTGYLTPLRIPDPAAISTAMLASMQPLGRGETAVMQWVISPTAAPSLPTSRSPRQISLKLPWPVQMLLNLFESPELTADQIATAKAKLSEPTFAGICRVGATASTRKRTRQLLRQIIAPLHITRTHAARFVRRPLPSWIVVGRLDRAAVPIITFPVLLNAAELAALTGYPLNSPLLPGLRIGAARQLPASTAIPRSGHIIGAANFPGAERPVAIGVRESLQHAHIIGPTGSGKSTLLINMVVQDMKAGRGVAVFDPKGDLIADLLERIPAGREDDVVLIDPTDPLHSVGLNLLEHNRADSSEVVVDQIVGVFSRLFAGFWGPRTADVLRSCLLTLAYHEGTTICDVPVLLQDPDYKTQILAKVDDPVGLEPFWKWYQALSDKERSQVVGPVLNKLRALLLRKSVRDIFGQATSSIQMSDVIAKRKILLISLPKGQLGEDTSALTGSMLFMSLWNAAQARGKLDSEQRTPFFCYIDEFQDYLNLPSGVADVLAQSRGFGLGLILAHQHLGQLTREVREAVMTNTRSKIVFQTSAGDARALADEFDPYLTRSDLQNLEPYQAMAMIAVDGQKAAPVSVDTLPPPPKTSNAAVVHIKSAQKYGRSRIAIELFMRSRLVAKFASDEIVSFEE